jgi:hypothetical protein
MAEMAANCTNASRPSQYAEVSRPQACPDRGTAGAAFSPGSTSIMHLHAPIRPPSSAFANTQGLYRYHA